MTGGVIENYVKFLAIGALATTMIVYPSCLLQKSSMRGTGPMVLYCSSRSLPHFLKLLYSAVSCAHTSFQTRVHRVVGCWMYVCETSSYGHGMAGAGTCFGVYGSAVTE